MAEFSLSYGASCVNRLHARQTVRRVLSFLTLYLAVSPFIRKAAVVILFGLLLAVSLLPELFILFLFSIPCPSYLKHRLFDLSVAVVRNCLPAYVKGFSCFSGTLIKAFIFHIIYKSPRPRSSAVQCTELFFRHCF